MYKRQVEYTDQGALSARLKAAGDTVIFTMHSNVFLLDQSNSLWKTSYLTDDNTRGYFGVINIYNFLSDSFVYDRERDLGYLVAVSYTHLRAHETVLDIVCRLLLEKKKHHTT